MFVNRENELRALKREYERHGPSLVVLYGRRRLGKTTLCQEFAKGRPSLYFLASEEGETENRRAFQEQTALFTGNSLLQAGSFDSWDPIFRAFAESFPDQKKVLILDEFQYLGKANAAFPSVFQRVYDTILRRPDVLVILCGSLVHMMEKQTLNYDSPLYGRRTAQIKLKQIPFREYGGFFPGIAPIDLVPLYAVTGGVPKYAELFQPAQEIDSMISEHVLDTSSFLYDEPNFLLRGEVTEVGSYFALIRTMAAGNQRLGEIAARLEVPQTRLTSYLRTLSDLDLVRREVPVTENRPDKSKRGLYRLQDNFLRFWFRFVYPNRGYLETGRREYVQSLIHRDFIPGHVAWVFEDVCRQRMWDLNERQAWPLALDRIGRWWNKDSEIDIVGLSKDQNAVVCGECKYWERPVGVNVLDDLRRKAFSVNEGKPGREEYFVIFSRSGFTPELARLGANDARVLLVGENGCMPF